MISQNHLKPVIVSKIIIKYEVTRNHIKVCKLVV